MYARRLSVLVTICLVGTACTQQPEVMAGTTRRDAPLVFAPDLERRLAAMPKAPIDYDHSLLSAEDERVVAVLVETSRIIDQIFLRQVSEDNESLALRLAHAAAEGAPGAGAALAYFRANYGPWDRVGEHAPFIGTTPKPLGAGYYPPELTKEAFDAWIAAHPQDAEAFRNLFTVIRKTEAGGLTAIPYSRYYADLLSPAAAKLRKAAQLTHNESLRKYLSRLADAFLSDDYFVSDLAWMDLDSDIEVILGPYEVYEDRLFNYKAAFESFVTVRDRAESEKLSVYAKHLPAMEQNLPMPDEHKNANRGSESPIRVVQQIFTAGDTRAGVQTSAFNLPNDERVREAKGSKKVLLKNVMEAKFRLSGKPIADRVLDESQGGALSFPAYFNIVLFHELSHGLGPGIIVGPDGNKVEARLLLGDVYSMIEECKADVLGVWNALYALERDLLDAFDTRELFVTYAGLMFRSMRFGIQEAHGGGNAIQWNWMREHDVIVATTGNRFRVDLDKMREQLRALGNELLMIEATGDAARAKKLIDRYARSNPEIDRVIAALADIPIDITPVYVGAGETMPPLATGPGATQAP